MHKNCQIKFISKVDVRNTTVKHQAQFSSKWLVSLQYQ